MCNGCWTGDDLTNKKIWGENELRNSLVEISPSPGENGRSNCLFNWEIRQDDAQQIVFKIPESILTKRQAILLTEKAANGESERDVAITTNEKKSQ